MITAVRGVLGNRQRDGFMEISQNRKKLELLERELAFGATTETLEQLSGRS
jgi:hypothetical protein